MHGNYYSLTKREATLLKSLLENHLVYITMDHEESQLYGDADAGEIAEYIKSTKETLKSVNDYYFTDRSDDTFPPDHE